MRLLNVKISMSSTHVHTNEFALVCIKMYFESDENTMLTTANDRFCKISTGNSSYSGRRACS